MVKLRSYTIIRESLGTALYVPGLTRWLSRLFMICNFLDNCAKIREVVETHHSELLSTFDSLAQCEKLEAYRKILEPVAKRIKFLEVKFIILFKILKF